MLVSPFPGLWCSVLLFIALLSALFLNFKLPQVISKRGRNIKINSKIGVTFQFFRPTEMPSPPGSRLDSPDLNPLLCSLYPQNSEHWPLTTSVYTSALFWSGPLYSSLLDWPPGGRGPPLPHLTPKTQPKTAHRCCPVNALLTKPHASSEVHSK